MIVIHDTLNLSTTLRSCGFAVRLVSLDDLHARHEVLANIIEGTIMGALIGLRGPSSTALIANQSRSRNNERKQDGRRQDDTRRVARQHEYLTEIMKAIQAFKGFTVLHASARNDIWKFNTCSLQKHHLNTSMTLMRRVLNVLARSVQRSIA